MNNLVCDTCQKEFRNVKALDAHVRNAHPGAITKAYHCAQCNNSFRFKEAMETHMENVHGIAGEAGEVVNSASIVKLELDGNENENDLELIGMEEGEGELAEIENLPEGEQLDDEEGEKDDLDAENEEEMEEALEVYLVILCTF